MKFFTRDYLEGRLSDAEFDSTHDRYASHLERLKNKLPSAVTALSELPLHDGLIEQVIIDRSADTVTAAIIAGDLQVGYERFTLEYAPADMSPEDEHQLRAAAQDPATELLYDELDEAANRRFEHRMVFTPHREIAIRFTNLTVTRKPLARREITTAPEKRFAEIGAA